MPLTSERLNNQFGKVQLENGLQIYCQFSRIEQKMNIHMFLMGKSKCETFFPKLAVKDYMRSSSNKYSKKRSTHKIRNPSIDKEGNFRVTYHDILQPPASLHENESVSEPQSVKKPVVKKQVDSVIKINGYQVCKEIGKGGFAEVVEIKDETGNKFAMKQYILQNSLECFKNQYIVGQHFFEKGKLKSKFAQKRGGSSLINYVEKIKQGKKGYIIQELGGKSLSKAICDIQGVFHKGERVYEIKFTKFFEGLANKKNLSILLSQIASGIKLLNSEGFIHCDLKPQNILINDLETTPSCKIIDFGSAFLYKQGVPKITITPEYMPPQLLIALESDQQNVNLSKIDVWSIGCIMLQIMTGVPLWFRYKCKINVRGRQSLQLSYFALTNRQYHKIVKKQRQLCQSIKRINFIYPEFEAFRKILIRILTFDDNQRASIDEVIQMLDNIQ